MAYRREVEGDPAEDIRSLTNVRYTLRDGEVIYAAPAGPR